MNNSVAIPEILRQAKTIAVVGLSANRSRPSYGVAKYMQSQGYRIIPVNPKYSVVLNEQCYASLLDIPKSIPIDIVNIFRRPEAVLPIVEEAIKIGAKGIWMQEGVIHQTAAEQAQLAGLWVVMDRCLFKDHSHYVQKSL
ncbi:MAG: CoA-binding protein [Acidobacteria bacterium]|nr:MAG: CoA-binding protein [Acidobacteriota bacterium]